MGYGSYNAADWSKLKASRNISASSSASEIFTQRETDPKFDPKFIDKREARDSEDHPNSTPIIIGLDVTGSMGYLSEQIAKEALNETMLKLYASNDIEDPAILFAAYGDKGDLGALQVTQFESDIRIGEQLLKLWLENGGCGCVAPYLLWYFAAKHTKLDSYDKHNKKGFLITIGDNADIRTDGVSEEIKRVFGDDVSLSAKDCLEMAKEKFEVIHIFIGDPTNGAKEFAKMMSGRYLVTYSDQISALPEMIISSMLITSGKSQEDVLKMWSECPSAILKSTLSTLTVGNEKKGFFF